MKIASEIAAIQYPLEGGQNGARRVGLESIIAAKLKPIKDALSMMWEDLDMPASEMIEKYEAALALFEDE